MRVAGRLMQLDWLEHSVSHLQYQGNEASLPPDLVDIVRHYEQVISHFSRQSVSNPLVGWQSLSSESFLFRRGRQFFRAVFADTFSTHD
jgi:hypothetical protein